MNTRLRRMPAVTPLPLLWKLSSQNLAPRPATWDFGKCHGWVGETSEIHGAISDPEFRHFGEYHQHCQSSGIRVPQAHLT